MFKHLSFQQSPGSPPFNTDLQYKFCLTSLHNISPVSRVCLPFSFLEFQL